VEARSPSSFRQQWCVVACNIRAGLAKDHPKSAGAAGEAEPILPAGQKRAATTRSGPVVGVQSCNQDVLSSATVLGVDLNQPLLEEGRYVRLFVGRYSKPARSRG
jgi:hypothetical protein